MPPLKRVKRANPYDLYRTCKRWKCPLMSFLKVEGKTVADKYCSMGSMGVYWRLALHGSGRPTQGGYVPLRGGGSSTSLSSRGSGSSTSISRPFAGGIPLETLETVGAFRPGIIEEVAPTLEGVLPDAPAVVTPEAVPVDQGLSGLDVAREVTQESLITFLQPEGPDDIAVLELRPTEHDQTHLISTSTHPNPLFHAPIQQSSIIAETSGSENIFVGGGGVGSTTGEEIELTLFGQPKTSTPEGPINRGRGIFNWFNRTYYTQVPVEDPDEIAAAGSYVFENALYDSKAYKHEQQPWLSRPQDAPEFDFQDAVRLLQGPSGRVGWSRIIRPTSIGTRSGVRVGPLYHLRQSFSTIDEPETIELIPSTVDEEEVLTGVPESAEGPDAEYSDIDLQSIGSDEPLLGTGIIYPLVGGGQIFLCMHRAPVGWSSGTYINHEGQSRDDGEYVIDNGGQSNITPTVVIDGSIALSLEYFRHYYLHPSLLRRKRKRNPIFI
ncbi:minor capsid protein [Odocoileus virginianus papillomavirus 1]|uniref:Minor capsid protein L2 n=1 Tax=Odocoileus virginianus papillomavirus 1 TaxID=2772504 RepID=VL2_OVPVD|nr:minor capsid protein [Deltapapillomavirus 2]P03110.1 RecName: Full=Minor capsid protein L2 [Odocoileus virginianus papillomavirus 1]AAA66846.1 minor capsid protein [Odocoileus virginianus papillomavirus 1]